MLELKTKNSHDHGTNAIGASSLPIHSSSLYSRVEDFVFLFYIIYIHSYIPLCGRAYSRNIGCRFTIHFLLFSVHLLFSYYFIYNFIYDAVVYLSSGFIVIFFYIDNVCY